MRERDDEDLAIEQLPADTDQIELAIAAPSGLPRDPAARRARQRLEDLDARASRLNAQRELLTRQLDESPASRQGDDRGAPRRAHLEAALRATAREIELARDQRALLGRNLENAPSERHRLGRWVPHGGW